MSTFTLPAASATASPASSTLGTRDPFPQGAFTPSDDGTVTVNLPVSIEPPADGKTMTKFVNSGGFRDTGMKHADQPVLASVLVMSKDPEHPVGQNDNVSIPVQLFEEPKPPAENKKMTMLGQLITTVDGLRVQILLGVR